MIRRFFFALGLICLGTAAHAACVTLPFTLTNGTLADATQVMANFNALVTCINAPGTIFGNQGANNIYAGPASGGAAAPTFRALVTADWATQNLATTGTIATTNTTNATTPTSGALQSAGGLGVAKDAWIGGLANIAGNATVVGNLAVTGTTNLTGAVTMPRGGSNHATPANPTGTMNTSATMMGLGASCQITPVTTGRVVFMMSAVGRNDTMNDGWNIQMSFADNSITPAPANAAAFTGTVVALVRGNFVSATSNAPTPYAMQGLQSGLTLNHVYWYDAALGAVLGGTASIVNPTCDAFELN